MLRLLSRCSAMALPPVVYRMVAYGGGAGLADGMKQNAFVIGMASTDQRHVGWGARQWLCPALLPDGDPAHALAYASSPGVNLLLACALVQCLVLVLLVRGLATGELILVCLIMLDFLPESAGVVFASHRILVAP